MLKRFREVYGLPSGIFTYILLIIGTVGIIDSFYDMNGERFLAYLPIFMPGILSSWYLVSIVFKKNASTKEFTSRFYFAFFIGALPFMIFQIMIAFIIANLPFAQEIISDNYGTHAFWPPELAYQIIFASILMFFTTWITLLFFTLLFGLPIIALKSPRTLLTGSIFDKMKDRNLQRKLLAIVFFSLSSFVVGIIANKVTVGIFSAQNINYGFHLILRTLLSGKLSLLQFFWLIGWVFIGLSVLGFIYVIIRFILYSNTTDHD